MESAVRITVRREKKLQYCFTKESLTENFVSYETILTGNMLRKKTAEICGADDFFKDGHLNVFP